MRMAKLCFLLFNLEPGGLQTNLLRFIEFSKGNLEITVVVKGARINTLENEYVKAGAKVHWIETGYFNLMGWYRIFQFFKGNKWDSVCDLTGNFGGVYMALSKLAGVPNRIAYYGQTSNHFSPGFVREKYNWLVNLLVKKYSTSIISNSAEALDFFIGSNWKENNKVRIINNGVSVSGTQLGNTNIRQELNIPAGAKMVLNVARYDKNKNQQTILKVAEVICKERQDVYFLLCGKDTGLLEVEINDRGLKGRCFALGNRTDIGQVLTQSNLFFFPSISEGQPNALIEAIICGVPFVASNIREIKEILPGECHGQLVSPMDVESAKLKILEALDGNIGYSVNSLKEFCQKNFDPEIRFREFGDAITLNKRGK